MSLIRGPRAAALAAFGMTIATSAETITVCTSGCDYPSISDAVLAAADGDLILVGPGVYADSVDTAGKSLSIQSTNGPSQTILEPDSNTRQMIVPSGQALVAIDGFTFRNGHNTMLSVDQGNTVSVSNCRFMSAIHATENPAAFDVNGATALLSDCDFFFNRSKSFGACRLANATASFLRCNFDSNTVAEGYNSLGGAIHCIDSELLAQESVFRSNRAEISYSNAGGGIFLVRSSASLSDCVFETNTCSVASWWGDGTGVLGGDVAAVNCESLELIGCDFRGSLALGNSSGHKVAQGGSIHLSDCGSSSDPVRIQGCTFADCSAEVNNVDPAYGAEAMGGAIFGARTAFLLEDSVFLRTNVHATLGAAALGGAVFLSDSPAATIRRCQFERASAVSENNKVPVGGGGGAIWMDASGGLLSECSFLECSSGDGGAIRLRSLSSPSILDCEFTGNIATDQGGAIACLESAPVILISEFRGNAAAVGGAIFTEATSVLRPLIGDSLFCENHPDHIAGPFVDNGGISISSLCVEGCPTDMDGDGSTGGSDLGLFFVSWNSCTEAWCPGDFNGDAMVNGVDLGILFSQWGQCE